jgi:hypothetical protein
MATDVWSYGAGGVGGIFWTPTRPSWPALKAPTGSSTNPPFKAAVDFALLGLERARHGVALLPAERWAKAATGMRGCSGRARRR